MTLKTVVTLLAAFLACLSTISGAELRNDAYAVKLGKRGEFTLVCGEASLVFRPTFIVLHSPEKLLTRTCKWQDPIYNLVGWKQAGKTEPVLDVFRAADTLTLDQPKISKTEGAIVWEFDHPSCLLRATLTLPEGSGPPRISTELRTRVDGTYSVAFSGAPAVPIGEVEELWMPLVWDGRRLPPRSFLIPDDQCSIPGCLVRSNGVTVGTFVDPAALPYEMPYAGNRKFGVTVRNELGLVQPLVFAPFPDHHAFKKGGEVQRSDFVLVAQASELSVTFEYVAREICGFRDQRENTLTTLNQTLENMSEYALSKWAAFDHANRSSYYPDAKGTVKNVSSLHPFGIALVTDEPRFFHEQARPIMEYLLSREKFLFATSEEGLIHSQKPSMNLNGPAMPVSELAALYRISGGASPVFAQAAQRLYAKDRTLNMNWVTKGATWKRSLSRYRMTGENRWLEDASAKADRYIATRIDHPPTDFAEAGEGTFFEYMTPWWKEMYELFSETGDPKHLRAAHDGARRYAQFVWFYPSVPGGEITVNKTGFSTRRGRPGVRGLIPVAKETVPAWRVSDQGLLCEGNGTAQRLGILLATHAPYFLRIAQDTGDEWLRDIARSAVIGRYANFPGYHLNTEFSTAQEKADFPLRPYEKIKSTTSMHFNHILPMTNLLIDYLISRAYDLSEGEIDFPSEFAEGYCYVGGRIYGAEPGKFYDESKATPWMPRGLLTTSDVQVNYVAARTPEGDLCVALMNASDRSLEKVKIRLDANCFEKPMPERSSARCWTNNAATAPVAFTDGFATVSLSPRGITAFVIPGLAPKIRFQDQVSPTTAVEVTNIGQAELAGSKITPAALCFGPRLRWLYTYVRTDRGRPDFGGAVLKISGHDPITDDAYPFEFSFPLSDVEESVEFEVEVVPD